MKGITMTKVLITIDEEELAEVRRLTGVDSNAPALLAAARRGVKFEKSRLDMMGFLKEAGK